MDTGMFHSGDLNSGISLAIQDNKVVLCFIRADDDYWSQIWEDYWLANKSQPMDMLEDPEPPLGMILSAKAVLLRIDYGSQESDFLNAFCPIEKVPTIAVIRGGLVLEKLEGGIAKDEFQERLLVACGMKGSQTSGGAEPQQGTSQPAEGSIYAGIPQSADDVPDDVQSMFDERAQRLEAARQQRAAAEKAERTARANARRKEAEDAANSQNDKGKQRATTAPTQDQEKQQARDAWIYQQKQRKDEAKKERERILNQIESDKQERRAQKERAKEVQTAGGAGAFSSIPGSDHSQIGPSSSAAYSNRQCALQIRLFDGSSIRGKFAPDTTLALAVRTWIKEASPAGGADIPYTFRQILAPQPSRSIEVSEEHQSLFELGLAPTATLVLVPVAGFTNAYSNPNAGYLSSAWSFAYSCASTAGGLLGSAISYIPGVGRFYMGGVGDEQEGSNVLGAQMAGADTAPRPENVKVKTLFDQQTEQAKKDKNKAAEFYNGNSSAFQGSGPNRGDEDDER